MALKGKPVAVGNTATTIYTCPATKEAAVHGLLFGNNTASALAVDVIVYNQATGSDVTVVTDFAVPANGIATWSKPINLNAGDAVKAVSSAASGMVCLYSTYEDGATPVASGFTARGAWSSAATYVANDIVSVSGTGTYVAIQGSTNQDPTTATAYWMFLEGISASALPAQSGNAGKYLTTDGSTASWGVVNVAGGSTSTSTGSNITLTSASNRFQRITPSAGIDVILPNATSLDEGGITFVISHSGTENIITVKNSSGTPLVTLSTSKSVSLYLNDNSTSDGSWTANVNTNVGSYLSLNSGPVLSYTPENANYASTVRINKLGGTRTNPTYSVFYYKAWYYNRQAFIEWDSVNKKWNNLSQLDQRAFFNYNADIQYGTRTSYGFIPSTDYWYQIGYGGYNGSGYAAWHFDLVDYSSSLTNPTHNEGTIGYPTGYSHNSWGYSTTWLDSSKCMTYSVGRRDSDSKFGVIGSVVSQSGGGSINASGTTAISSTFVPTSAANQLTSTKCGSSSVLVAYSTYDNETKFWVDTVSGTSSFSSGAVTTRTDFYNWDPSEEFASTTQLVSLSDNHHIYLLVNTANNNAVTAVPITTSGSSITVGTPLVVDSLGVNKGSKGASKISGIKKSSTEMLGTYSALTGLTQMLYSITFDTANNSLTATTPLAANSYPVIGTDIVYEDGYTTLFRANYGAGLSEEYQVILEGGL